MCSNATFVFFLNTLLELFFIYYLLVFFHMLLLASIIRIRTLLLCSFALVMCLFCFNCQFFLIFIFFQYFFTTLPQTLHSLRCNLNLIAFHIFRIDNFCFSRSKLRLPNQPKYNL